MNKFEKLIGDSSTGTLKRRAGLISSSAKIAQENMLNELKQHKIELNNRLVMLTDLAPDTTDSLRPGNKDWDARKWAIEVQNVKQELYDVEIQLKLASETYDEFFKELE